MTELLLFAPLHGPWLALLADGWRLSPAGLGHHGRHAVLLVREVADA